MTVLLKDSELGFLGNTSLETKMYDKYLDGKGHEGGWKSDGVWQDGWWKEENAGFDEGKP